MRTNLALARLRHARESLQAAHLKGVGWKAINGEIDRFAGLLVHAGLVHALLAMRKGCIPVFHAASGEDDEKKRAQTAAVRALVDWMRDNRSCVKETIDGMIGDAETIIGGVKEHADSDINALEKTAIALMQTEDSYGYMAVQEEAHRYAGAMKIVGKAFGAG